MRLFDITSVAVLSLALLSGNAAANSEFFLQLPGVKGESSNRVFSEWMDITGFSMSAESGADMSLANRRMARANLAPITITKTVDAASPILAQHATGGKALPTATIAVAKSGAGGGTFYQIDLKNVMISSYSVDAAEGEEALTETITLAFEEITWTYTPSNRAGGGGQPVTATYSVVEGVRK